MKDSKELKIMTVDDAVAQIEDNMVLGIGTVVPLNCLFQSSLKEFTKNN